MQPQGLVGMGGMGGSMRPPGKSGLTFDHILSRLQGELQKSRETGAELHSVNRIHAALGDMTEPSVQSRGSLFKTPIRALQPSTIQPVSDSPILVGPEAPACRRLISLAFTTHEVISLIEAIFADKEEVRMVRGLRGNAAQTFIEVVHGVRLSIWLFPFEPSPPTY